MSIPLRSGLYRLDLVVKDTLSGNLGVFNTALRVPHFEDDKLDASSLILADQIETVASSQTGTGQFVLNSYRVSRASVRNSQAPTDWASSFSFTT